VPRKATAHRALDDVRESVAELSYWRSTIFASNTGSAEQGV